MPIGSAHPTPPVGHVALLGNYPPRLCGIATFTSDVRAALVSAFPRAAIDVYAMDDGMAGDRWAREVVFTITQDEGAAYAEAAERINASGAEVLCVQHEYGIFGGRSGDKLLDLIDRVAAPLVLTLHTVLEQPNDDQRRVLDALAARASALIVMAEKGREILRRVHPQAADKIVVIPHGIPDRPLVEPVVMKPKFGWEGRPIVLTFGLLSPNKGLETSIRAMPAIVAKHPRALYVILGATHPHLVRHEGEAYRERLQLLANELGVTANVQFVDGFVETPKLLEYLSACDVYATPYLNEAQITSGTLSYAVGLGKPVVSTPYWHAAELLADGVGVLCPFGDAACFAREIDALLADNAKRAHVRKLAWSRGRAMVWPKLAESYMRVFAAARSVEGGAPQLTPGRYAAGVDLNLEALERMTDDAGIIQHAIHRVPDRHHGYCTDDNARALQLMHRVGGEGEARASALAWRYAAFVQHAWNPEAGRFRNFMRYERSWCEEVGSDDSNGRALLSLGLTAAEARHPDLRAWGFKLFEQAAGPLLELEGLRSRALCALAGDALLAAHPGHAAAMRLVEAGAQALAEQLPKVSRPEWRWFETALAYDNARLPEACIRAGLRLARADLVASGLETLDWLASVQTGDGGCFRAVGTGSIGRDYAPAAVFDQQALEALATIEAAEAALSATGDGRWITEAERAHAWYGGRNDLGIPLATEDGGCFDGLVRGGVNRNMGAESILSWMLAQAGFARVGRRAKSAPSRTEAAVRANSA